MSQEFKDLYEVSDWQGLVFYPIPKSKGFYLVECSQQVVINETKRPIEFENKCNECGLYMGVYGSVPFAIYGIEPEDTALYFPEMENFIGSCKFGLFFTHTHEPGCAILEALKKGNIHEDRYTSFELIHKELQETVKKY